MSAGPRDAVADAYRRLGAEKLVTGAAGNVSVRDGADAMLVTGSGVAHDHCDAASVIRVTFSGDTEPGAARAPSSEWPMHAAIYAADPAAMAIVHTHSDACTALACLNEDLPAFHYMVLAFGGDDVRCAPYVTFGTPALAEGAAAAIAGRTACLLANHGMIVHGPDLPRAMEAARLLETLCRQFLLARAAGTPRLLTPEEMAAARARFATYGERAPRRS